MVENNELLICKRKLEKTEREVATKDEKIKRLKTLCSHLLANSYQESKPKPSNKMKGSTTHLLFHSARRMWSHSFPSSRTRPSDLYPALRDETIAYIASSSTKIYTKISKVLTSEVLILFNPNESILKFNGSNNEEPKEQAVVLKQAYKLLNRSVTQARCREMGIFRGLLTGKYNNRFGR